jgi:hypothetical protein
MKTTVVYYRTWLVELIFMYIARVQYFFRTKAIKAKQEPIKVIFLVSENQKWNCDSLYKELDASEKFTPIIAVTKLERDSYKEFKVNMDFFRSRGYECFEAYDFQNDNGISLKKLCPDIVFYQQPYMTAKHQSAMEVAKYSLLCYVPYGLMVANNDYRHYRRLFQKLLWRYFAPNEIIKELYLENNKYNFTPQSKVVVSGHPKMDVYSGNIKSSELTYWSREKNVGQNKVRLIFAPHHSLEQDNSLHYATFDWNGLEILEYAKQNPETDWVFKPHPRLRHALSVNKIMTKEDVDKYYNEWENLPNTKICDTGDYFDLFRTSDGLITDCGSFLAEYLPTKKPIVLLINPKSQGYNRFGQMLVNSFYKANTFNELESIIIQVFKDGDDYKEEERLELLYRTVIPNKNSAVFIKSYLESELS